VTLPQLAQILHVTAKNLSDSPTRAANFKIRQSNSSQ
jgi:hypothetical protein